jgi:hypothetical protein
MKRLASIGLIGFVTIAAPAQAQVEVGTVAPTPPPPIDHLRIGRDIAAAPDGGVCVTGGGVRAVRFNATGGLLWEAMYEWDPAIGLWLEAESIQNTRAEKGWIIGASGGSTLVETGCFPKHDALVRIKDTGVLAWAVRFPGDHALDYAGYKYPPNIQVRELPDGSFFAVATRMTRNEELNCSRLCSNSSTGVALRVSGNGSPIFAREYGYNGQNAKSEMVFADLTVIGQHVYVLGTVDTGGGCNNGSDNFNTILVKMDFNGNVVQTWEYDRPAAEGANDWASSICSIGNVAYFSFVDHMPHYEAGDSTVVALNTATSAMLWANVYPDYHINYGSLEPGRPGALISGGHQGTGNTRAAGISTATGFPIWFRSYKDPIHTPPAFGEIAGVCTGGPASGYWLMTSAQSSVLYLMGTTSMGATVCSSEASSIPVSRAALTTRPATVAHFRTLEVSPLEMTTTFLPTETINPCRP